MREGTLGSDDTVDVAAPPVTRERPACFAVAMSGTELRDLDAGQWDALADAALDDNPFFARSIIMAGIDALREGNGIEALAFRLHRDGRLVGLFPFRRERFGRFLPLGDARMALNLYQPGGTPLIHADHAHAVVEAWLDLVETARNLPARWAFPHVELDGAFASLFRQHAGQRGFAVHGIETYKRPVLTRHPDGFEAHVETIIGKKRAKDIKRNLRRLGEMGTVRFERASDPQKVAERVEQFLAIEQAGWKGKKGTAFLSDPDHARFARLAYGDAPAIVDTLLLDETPIAVSINLGAGTTLFTPKCAFDETFRKFGPGLLLEYLVIETFYAEDGFSTMNAATTVDGHVISGFWNGERPMGTLIIGPDGWRTRLLAWIEDTGHGTRQWAKKFINRFRRPAA